MVTFLMMRLCVILSFHADKTPLLKDTDYDEEGYGPTAVRRAYMMPPDKLLEAEEKLLFIPALVAGEFIMQDSLRLLFVHRSTSMRGDHGGNRNEA